jgi:hypothetical protein
MDSKRDAIMKRARLVVVFLALALAGCDAGTSCAKGIDGLQSALGEMARGPVIDRVSGPAVAVQSLAYQAQLSRNTRDYEACSTKVQKARRHLRELSVF